MEHNTLVTKDNNQHNYSFVGWNWQWDFQVGDSWFISEP